MINIFLIWSLGKKLILEGEDMNFWDTTRGLRFADAVEEDLRELIYEVKKLNKNLEKLSIKDTKEDK